MEESLWIIYSIHPEAGARPYRYTGAHTTPEAAERFLEAIYEIASDAVKRLMHETTYSIVEYCAPPF